VTATVRQPTAAEFRARHRGGGLFTETVNQRIGSYLAVAGDRLKLAPTVLTLVNLLLGLAGSMLVIMWPKPAVGLAALLLWQLAYSFDCADGQLARVTGQTSAAGARVDVLCDVALQIALVTAVSAAASGEAPAWLIAAFAGTWMVNLVTSVLQQGSAGASLISSSSLPVRLVKLIRDYGAVITVIGIVLAVEPAWSFWLLVGFTVVNGGFLLASIAASARTSLRRAD